MGQKRPLVIMVLGPAIRPCVNEVKVECGSDADLQLTEWATAAHLSMALCFTVPVCAAWGLAADSGRVSSPVQCPGKQRSLVSSFLFLPSAQERALLYHNAQESYFPSVTRFVSDCMLI